MILIDVNILVNARRKDASRHAEYREWLADALGSAEPVAVASQSLAAVVRILSHRGIWKDPLTLRECLDYADLLRTTPQTLIVEPGERHWEVFARLCRDAAVHGNLVMDAWLAALAIEHDCTLVTSDKDFARFGGLKWRHPLPA